MQAGDREKSSVALIVSALAISLGLALIPIFASATPVPTGSPAADIDEPSGQGGIGNTRRNIFGYWKLDDTDEPSAELIDDHIQYVTYDLPDYQISFMFQLEDDQQVRPEDRAVDMIISFMSMTNAASAERMAVGWLPDDATKVGSPEHNRYNESIQQYRSETMKTAFPKLDHPRFREPGSIWITFWPIGVEVGVIEISIFYPRES